jgi:hypothetical protein
MEYPENPGSRCCLKCGGAIAAVPGDQTDLAIHEARLLMRRQERLVLLVNPIRMKSVKASSLAGSDSVQT